MLKKLNQKLISNYPLLWNTRVALIIPAALIIHVLFYIAGFLQPIKLTGLWVYSYYKMEGVIIFSVLISALMIIGWLTLYLRNNPFKSFYTIGKAYLYYEFLLIFAVFLSTSTFFLTYKQGLYNRIEIVSKDVVLEEDANAINLAMHFMAFDINDFDIRYSCDSLRADYIRDSLELLSKKNMPQDAQDSMAAAIAVLEAEYQAVDTVEYEKSYLHYCKQYIKFYSSSINIKHEYELGAIAQRWLKEKQKDSIAMQINKFIALCRKYGISNSINTEKQVNECFNDERHTVLSILSSSDTYPADEGKTNIRYSSYFANTYNLTQAIEKVETVRRGFWEGEVLIILLYYSLGMAIILFSFRTTRLKQWFMAIIGIGLLSVLLSLIVLGFHNEEQAIPALLLAIWAIVLFFALRFIYKQGPKIISGIFLNWVFWFMPFVIPLVFVLLYEATDTDCYEAYQQGLPCPPDKPIHRWIAQNWDIINGGNVVLILLLLLVYVGLVRKWQANPEE